MEVKKKNVWKDSTSCNFCNRGKLSGNGRSLVYPYETVYEFKKNGGGLLAVICDDCMNELHEKRTTLTEK